MPYKSATQRCTFYYQCWFQKNITGCFKRGYFLRKHNLFKDAVQLIIFIEHNYFNETIAATNINETRYLAGQ